MVGRTRSREDAKGSGWEELHGLRTRGNNRMDKSRWNALL